MNILSTIYMQNKILRGVYRVQQTEAKTTVDTVYIISLLAILCISRDVVSPILSHQPSLCNFTLSNAETILLVNGASRRERVNWASIQTDPFVIIYSVFCLYTMPMSVYNTAG